MRKVKFYFCIICLLFTGAKEKETASPYKFPELKFFPPMPVRQSDPVTKDGAALGRYLFYDTILSLDGNMSCATCHRQEAAFSDAPNPFSKGRNDELMERNTMPLFNLAWYPGFFWDGRAASIEEQILSPVRMHNEMNLQWTEAARKISRNKFYASKFSSVFGERTIDSTLITNAIGQFLRTLLSYGSKFDKVLVGEAKFTKDEYDGFVLVNDQTKGDCLHCHTTDADALGTTRTYSNNGLDSVSHPEDYRDKGRGTLTGNKNDYGKFKIPSLRNAALTAPYMHDGRFKTLEEVVNFYSEGLRQTANIDSKMEFVRMGGARLSAEEKRKIIAFLKTLTDSSFITNPEFGNPFIK